MPRDEASTVLCPPMLGVALCYGIGIGIACYLPISFSATRLFVIVGVLLIILLSPWVRQCLGNSTVCFIAISLALLGFVRGQVAMQVPTLAWSTEAQSYIGILGSAPTLGPHSATYDVWLIPEGDEEKDITLPLLRLTLTHDSLCTYPSVGNAIVFKTKIQPLRNAGNPEEVDYATWYRRHGYTGRAVSYAGNWQPLSNTTTDSLTSYLGWSERIIVWGAQSKEALIARYRTYLAPQVVGLISGITLGDKRGLDPQIQSTFSQTGISHILALSGLHVSILYLFFSLSFLRIRHKKDVRGLLALGLIWGFAALVGFPLSLMRSVWMLTCMHLTSMLSRPSSGINNLAIAALILLVIDAQALWDIGFQLSVVAVYFIIALSPFWQRYAPRQSVLSYLYGLVTVSLSAQLGVSALVAYYFHTFPLYFLLANLVTLPATFVLMLLALLFWLFTYIWMPPILITLIYGVVEGMLYAVERIARWPYATLTWLPSLWYVALYYVGAWWLVRLLQESIFNKRTWMILCGVLLILVTAGWGDIILQRPITPQIILYNDAKDIAIHYIGEKETPQLYLTSETDLKRVRKQHETLWLRHNLKRSKTLILENESPKGKLAAYTSTAGIILTLPTTYGGNCDTSGRLLYITRHSDMSKVLTTIQQQEVRYVVLANNLTEYKRSVYHKLVRESSKARLFDLNRQGALVLYLTPTNK